METDPQLMQVLLELDHTGMEKVALIPHRPMPVTPAWTVQMFYRLAEILVRWEKDYIHPMGVSIQQLSEESILHYDRLNQHNHSVGLSFKTSLPLVDGQPIMAQPTKDSPSDAVHDYMMGITTPPTPPSSQSGLADIWNGRVVELLKSAAESLAAASWFIDRTHAPAAAQTPSTSANQASTSSVPGKTSAESLYMQEIAKRQDDDIARGNVPALALLNSFLTTSDGSSRRVREKIMELAHQAVQEALAYERSRTTEANTPPSRY